MFLANRLDKRNKLREEEYIFPRFDSRLLTKLVCHRNQNFADTFRA